MLPARSGPGGCSQERGRTLRCFLAQPRNCWTAWGAEHLDRLRERLHAAAAMSGARPPGRGPGRDRLGRRPVPDIAGVHSAPA